MAVRSKDHGHPASDEDAVVEALLQFQIRELDELKSREDHHSNDDTSKSLGLAADLLEKEIEATRTYLADRRMAKSVAEAVQTDGQLIMAETVAEVSARRDHELAQRLQGQRVSVTAPIQQDPINNEKLSKLAGRYQSEEAGKQLLLLDKGHEKNIKNQCIICQDRKPYYDVTAALCPSQHQYCRDCVQELFTTSFTDESVFPPRCCKKPIPLSSVDIFLNRDILDKFKEKEVEFGTQNRTYCSDTSCAKFIPPVQVSGTNAKCGTCSKQTCTVCKAPMHPTQDCSQDTALKELKKMAQQNGWQRCYNCERMVELKYGCYHITCICRAQFCYLCGARWKTCRCPQWDESRLTVRATEIAQRGGNRERVQELVARLRAGHNCSHSDWESERGEFRCEICSDIMPIFIYECSQCRLLACRRCRYNRL